MKPESREKKADQAKSGKKSSKRQRMSSREKDSVTPTADTDLTGPESTQIAGIVVVETESPPVILSRRHTPVRQSAQAARLLLSTSRSKKGKKPSRKKKLGTQNKETNSSTTMLSLRESEEGLNTQQLLKKEKLKKPHKERISASASATLVAYASQSKLSTSVYSETSASKSKSKRSTTACPKTTEHKGEQSVVISNEDKRPSELKLKNRQTTFRKQ